MSWPEPAPEPLRPALVRLARRLALGAPLESALRGLRPVFEEDADALAFVLDVTGELGGRSAAMVETLAASADTRFSFLSQARAAGSGAVLSGRLIAALPLAFIPLTPLADVPLFDPLGVVMLLGGAALAAVGMAWIGRLTPDVPRSDDPVAAMADLIAAVLDGGTHHDAALTFLSAHPPASLRPQLHKAYRLVRLGARWPDALASSGDPGLESLANALRRADALGVSVRSSLEAWARARRRERAHDFDAATRRAGVLMMVPLATCVLPAFILLGVVPFLRGLSLQ